MNGFEHVLNYIRSTAQTEMQKGQMFERLMKSYFEQDPIYQSRFSQVSLWSKWTEMRDDFDAKDIGIDLVAKEREGGYCAIQCKCFSPQTRITKNHINTFITASDREPFTARLFVDTGDAWGPNAVRSIERLKTPCQVLRFEDLSRRPFDWENLNLDKPENLSLRADRFELHPHQQSALDDVCKGFEKCDRGKLIMACGTGKTFTALRIAERIAGIGARVLYLVPSISLLQQTMREWAEQRAIEHRYIGICSDTRAGKYDEDASLVELEIPVTTNPIQIKSALKKAYEDSMLAVFCTYQSLELIEQSQAYGAANFDLIMCDEAHRTTGVDRTNMVDAMPDLGLLSACQCFPRYQYEWKEEFFGKEKTLERIDNISEVALRNFQTHYKDTKIEKDAIFNYIYGILHSPEYVKRFGNDLRMELPRIPFVKDFWAFSKAGASLADWHLNYETCERYPLNEMFNEECDPNEKHCLLTEKKMRFEESSGVLKINEHIRLEGIPQEASDYRVNGRTPLEWFISMYYIKKDKKSGIKNDPNGWFEKPHDLIEAIERIVKVSVETARIVKALPELCIEK